MSNKKKIIEGASIVSALIMVFTVGIAFVVGKMNHSTQKVVRKEGQKAETKCEAQEIELETERQRANQREDLQNYPIIPPDGSMTYLDEIKITVQ